MKKYILSVLPLLALALSFTSCSDDNKIQEESVITVDSYVQNDFDKWLEANYINPYNISFKYRYEEIESDLNYYTVPAQMDNSIIMAHLVKYLCVETYNEVAGVDFTRRYFPKMFFLIGEWEYRNNGTFILGTAEGGRKILLAGINDLGYYLNNADDLNHFYIKTIHHEFTHILNQTRSLPTAFKEVTGAYYVADSWSDSPYDQESVFLKRGYITHYSQHSPGEDFAEMVSEYITHDAAWWDSMMAKAKGTYEDDQTATGAALIQQKLDIVRSYLHDAYNIDLDQLRDVVLRRQGNVVSGKVDLTDISL